MVWWMTRTLSWMDGVVGEDQTGWCGCCGRPVENNWQGQNHSEKMVDTEKENTTIYCRVTSQ